LEVGCEVVRAVGAVGVLAQLGGKKVRGLD
jgi:hypothetical protein